MQCRNKYSGGFVDRGSQLGSASIKWTGTGQEQVLKKKVDANIKYKLLK